MRTLMVAATLALAGGVAAQKASYTVFGKGSNCSGVKGCSGTVQLKVYKLPKLGETMVVHPDVGLPFLVFYGTSTSRWGPYRLPLLFPSFFVPDSKSCSNCWIFGDPRGLELLVSCDLTMMNLHALRIPNDPRLLGLHFYQQMLIWAWYGGYGPCRPRCRYQARVFLMTNGGHAVIGR